MKEEIIKFINTLLDDIHNINPELAEKRYLEFNKMVVELGYNQQKAQPNKPKVR
ncbi:MAG: hypothetical protein IH795_00790 [Bacteroidetes bacterium]|nr:hypothetical protein [Bacteroidota bacterium]